MALGKAGWLEQVLRGVVGAWMPDVTSQSALKALALPVGRARAQRYVRGMLRESGLLYGTPNTPALPRDDAGPEEQLFLAVLRVFARLALDVAAQVDAAPGPRPEQLLGLFAVLSHRLDLAADVHKRIERAAKAWPLPQKLWLQVEEALAERALSLASDPYYGLVLHNGALYADGNLYGRAAIEVFSTSAFPHDALDRRLVFADAQKQKLVEVLVGLVTAERKPGFPARRAILRQIEDLRLPEAMEERTTELARRAFDRTIPIKRLVGGIRSREMKRFIVEQTLLASLVDGRRSPREVAWTHELGTSLGFSAEALRVMGLEMADFYKRHRQVVDVFSLSGGAEVMGEEWVDELSGVMRKNYRALLREVKKTGELSVLLGRAARGQTLSAEEKATMRSQLIDVAKAVPALAIFAAPGGLLLLLALAKVLPFDIRPSAFRDDAEDEG